MDSPITLYSMETEEWRKAGFNRGDCWRSAEIFKCNICHVKTNFWVMGGCYSTGPRILCPGDEYEEHDELQSACTEFNKLENLISDFTELLNEHDGNEEIDAYIARQGILSLMAQKELYRLKILNVRKLFTGLDNVEGSDDHKKIKHYIPSSRFLIKKKLQKS